jgi:DNA-binding beta-propeller fold protein YncE
MRSRTLLAAIVGLLLMGASPAGYQVVKKVPLPGSGGWDYLAVGDVARRIYVSHATQVVVLDADSLEIVGTISGLAGVHGIALAPEFGRGFITSGQTDTVAVFDLKTLKKTADVKVGKKPDAIVYDSATKQIFAMNGDGESSTAINAADNSVMGTIALGGSPEFTIADGKGHVFVNLEDKSELLQINAKTHQVQNRWKVAPCEAPSSMAFDFESSRLFLGCRSKVMTVVDSENGKVIASYPIGEKADASVFDKSGKIAFTSTGDGHIYGFLQNSADTYTALPVIDTATGSKTMTMDQKTRHLFVPVRDKDAISLWVLQPN